ncbi:uncharacterized protein BXIN_2103 [Babesia sp. Xinjiang]|uniref:uncharacterized protein n=1 Tax=Babesia sp. Xinjiang TaxID=462227 RepID=UPI000A249667|nr:uncharacterized protein BXIN_2103 [Babesia sp. Xinjiang]ORM40629.1 hypothetical protein BXIN_2103 [Babesia sp. Xinjiang]
MAYKNVSSLRRRSCGDADLADDASYKTSSIGTVTPSGAVSPTFHKSFMEMQRDLQSKVRRADDDNLEYIRVLQSCLSGAVGDPSTPWSRSTASSEVETPRHNLVGAHKSGTLADINWQGPYLGVERRTPGVERIYRKTNRQFSGFRGRNSTRSISYDNSETTASDIDHCFGGDEASHHDGSPLRHGLDRLNRDANVGRINTNNTNVILLDDGNDNARLEVSLRKLRTGIQGQQRLIRLHRVGTHLELEYSEAVEDLELSYVATEHIAKSQAIREQKMTPKRMHPQWRETCATGVAHDDQTETVSRRQQALWLAAGAICATIAYTVYFRNRSTAVM